jgi:hypothetical protein
MRFLNSIFVLVLLAHDNILNIELCILVIEPMDCISLIFNDPILLTASASLRL